MQNVQFRYRTKSQNRLHFYTLNQKTNINSKFLHSLANCKQTKSILVKAHYYLSANIPNLVYIWCRPDQRALEEGDVEAAEQLKHQLEQAQRDRRRDTAHHTPAWFRYVSYTTEQTTGFFKFKF